MRRTICCAVFGLLVSSGAVFPQPRIGLRSLARPRVKVVGVRWFAARPAIFLPYGIPVPFPYYVPDPVPYPVWNFIVPLPTYVFVGSASASHPQLVFKDGLLARQRSTPLHHDRRRWNEVRTAHRAVRGSRCATHNRRRCSARVSVRGKRRTDRAMA